MISVKDASGNTITSDSNFAILNSIRYRGYYYDTESELYYLQSRYYDPTTGRFVNADSFEYLGASDSIKNYNLFSYCDNNPVILFDPDGTIAITTCVIIGAIAGAVIGGAIGGAIGYKQAVKNKVAKSDQWKYVVGYGLGGAVIGGVIGGFVGYGVGFLCGATGSSGIALRAVSKGLNSIPNKTWSHIITNKHAWNLVMKFVTRNGVKNIISKVMKNGATTLLGKYVNKGIVSMVFQASLKYSGETIIVNYSVIDGIIRISDAWVKTR